VRPVVWRRLGRLGGLAGAQHALDDLLLLDEESAHDALAHALRAAGSSVRAGHAALAALQGLESRGADGGQAAQSLTAVAALGQLRRLGGVLEDQLATRGLHLAHGISGRAEGVTTAVSQTLHHFCCVC